jgi:flagellar basal-body rod protein FlgF
MSHTIYTAYAGLASRAEALEMISHNLANLQSAGFKRTQFFFQALNQLRDHSLSPLGGAINGPVVRAWGTTDFSGGSLAETGNPLDLALTGDGFFAVDTPSGVRYTRNGHFTLNSAGELLTSDGHRVLGEGPNPEGQPLILPPGRVEVAPAGQITVDGVPAGRLRLVSFDDLSRLTAAGASLFRAEPGMERVPPSKTGVVQGFLEQANVGAVESVTEMIALMRSFEMLTQTIRSLNQDVDQKMINEVGRF